jgi:hypothetical protein
MSMWNSRRAEEERERAAVDTQKRLTLTIAQLAASAVRVNETLEQLDPLYKRIRILEHGVRAVVRLHRTIDGVCESCGEPPPCRTITALNGAGL